MSKWNGIDERRKNREYVENEKDYQEMRKHQDNMDLARVADKLVKSKDSVYIDASKYGLDDEFMSYLLEQMDDIDMVYDNNRTTDSRISDIGILDIDSKANHRKHGMLLSNANENILKLMLIDGSNNKYSYISLNALNPNSIKVSVSQYENGELYRYSCNVQSDNRMHNFAGDYISKDRIEKMFYPISKPSIEKMIPYVVRDISTIEVHGEKIDNSGFINFDNGLMIAAMMFNNGIGKYVLSKKDTSGEVYLEFDDEKIEQDILEIVDYKKQSR